MGNRVYSSRKGRGKEEGKKEGAKNGEKLKDTGGKGWMSEVVFQFHLS